MTTEIPKKNTPNLNALEQVLQTSNSFTKFEDLERYLEAGNQASLVPLQPLYLAMKNLPAEHVAHYLPLLTTEQRSALLDLDLWVKDEVRTDEFGLWPQAYAQVTDDHIREEFARSEQFLLYIKNRLNIHTFDAEDPQYPDHDYYFLTDDNLLLFEYDEDFSFAEELKSLIRTLYSDLGVEKAYAHLFKMLSDSYSQFEEEEYLNKKSRLTDFGYVDYYESLEFFSPFANYKQVENFILQKQKTPGQDLPEFMTHQTIHSKALTSFTSLPFHTFIDELNKVIDEKRNKFLQFNFLRLMNASLSYTNALNRGSVAVHKTGKNASDLLLLGFDTIKTLSPQIESIFDYFDFKDLHKIAYSILQIELKRIKKGLHDYQFEKDPQEAFLGPMWENFLDNCFAAPAKLDNEEIVSYNLYKKWKNKINDLLAFLPYAKKLKLSLDALKANHQMTDHFYLNYDLSSIDVEAILITSYIQFTLRPASGDGEQTPPKFGLTLNEFKQFIMQGMQEVEGVYRLRREYLTHSIDSYSAFFGFNNLASFSEYLQNILQQQLDDINYMELADDEFKHIGGPILLINGSSPSANFQFSH